MMTPRHDDIIALHEVAERLSVAPDLLKRMIEERVFPAPTTLESGAIGWTENQVDDWIAARPRVTDIDELHRLLNE